MLKSFFLSLIVVVSFFPARLSAQQNPPEVYGVGEAYEIYSTILSPGEFANGAGAKTLLIRAETGTTDEMCLKPEGESVAIVGPAIANFIEVNKKPWLLQKAIQLDRPYEFVFGKEIDGFFSNGVGGWKSFYEKYPGSAGYMELSAVGFNSDKTVAVVYTAHFCGGLCGGGGFEVLEKKDGKWQPLKWKGSTCSWVS